MLWAAAATASRPVAAPTSTEPPAMALVRSDPELKPTIETFRPCWVKNPCFIATWAGIAWMKSWACTSPSRTVAEDEAAEDDEDDTPDADAPADDDADEDPLLPLPHAARLSRPVSTRTVARILER